MTACTRSSRGELLFGGADASAMVVESPPHEIDINQVQTGQSCARYD
jgi:hypothetical protein